MKDIFTMSSEIPSIAAYREPGFIFERPMRGGRIPAMSHEQTDDKKARAQVAGVIDKVVKVGRMEEQRALNEGDTPEDARSAKNEAKMAIIAHERNQSLRDS
jgi:hypothetical protein